MIIFCGNGQDKKLKIIAYQQRAFNSALQVNCSITVCYLGVAIK
ncbi:hypothetical protein NSTC731_06207 [Nostoc sp. DSM 114167]|jgi:hypothetical protein